MDKGKWKRAILCAGSFGFLLWLVCLIYCAVWVSRMETLCYNAWGWGVVLAEYEFDFVNDCVEVNYYDFDGTLATHKEDTLSEKQKREVKQACLISFMPLWKSSYIDPGVADGDQWYITADDGFREKYVYGSNAYPLTYRKVYRKIRSIADGMSGA